MGNTEIKKEKKFSMFAILQQIGKSLFLPIAILPFAGLLLGVGSSFTNEAMLATYGLDSIFYKGSFLYAIMLLFCNVGNVIFNNLPFLFALAVALGMTKNEKGIAVISSSIFYIVMLMTMNSCLANDGIIIGDDIVKKVPSGAITEVLGIPTLQIGVFGGVIAGLVSAALCNKFYKIELPKVLAFFGGVRFVPIICMVFGIIVGFIMYHVWPSIQAVIFELGSLVQKSGYFGSFIYGCIQRSLIPFGLHHIFYMPFWQSGVGGSLVVDGVVIEGAQNIFFAQLASKNTVKFSVEACRFLTGPYAFMMGGLPGAAFAMYSTAKKENKNKVAGLLLSTALTSFLTGITEPIEFTFLFVGPILYFIHVIFAGLAYAISHILNICIGTTFSDGFIDFLLYGILPGNDKTNWIMMIPVILAYFAIYYFIFRFVILKLDLKTPGRGDENEEVKLITKAEYQKLKGINNSSIDKNDEKSNMILNGLGGLKNLVNVDCCATRLRVTVNDENKVNEALLKLTGAVGVVINGTGVQVIYGPKVSVIKSTLEEYIEKVKNSPELVGIEDNSNIIDNSINANNKEIIENKKEQILLRKQDYEKNKTVSHNEIVLDCQTRIDKKEVIETDIKIVGTKCYFNYVISDECGMHARPAAELIKFLKNYGNEINIRFADKEVVANSIINIMSLGIKKNDTIEFIIDGKDGEKLVKEIKEFLIDNKY